MVGKYLHTLQRRRKFIGNLVEPDVYSSWLMEAFTYLEEAAPIVRLF